MLRGQYLTSDGCVQQRQVASQVSAQTHEVKVDTHVDLVSSRVHSWADVLDGEHRSIIPQTSAPIQQNTDVNQGASKSYDGADMSVSKSSVCADVL